MIRVKVTYKVKEGRVEENEELVRAVYDELQAIGDPDVHYATGSMTGAPSSTSPSFPLPRNRRCCPTRLPFAPFRRSSATAVKYRPILSR